MWFVLALLIGTSPMPPAVTLRQQLGTAECTLIIDAVTLPLSRVVELTLVVEGNSPVEVEIPRPLTTSADWRIRIRPPQTRDLGNGRQRWQQTFQLDPFQVGEVAFPLQPIHFRTGNEVRDRTLTWPTQTFTVQTSVSEVELGTARLITDIEKLPPAEKPVRWYWNALAALVIAMSALLLVRGLRRRRPVLPLVTARERALEAIDALEPRAEQLPQLADALRRFLDDHFSLAATRQTTAEFEVSLRDARVLSPAQIETVRGILACCDLVKFAGLDPDRDACQTLRHMARDVVTSAGEARQESSTASSTLHG